MTLSQISSHYAGLLKAHAPSSHGQAFAWEAMMTMAVKIENMGKEISDLREQLGQVGKVAESASKAAAPYRRIG